MSKQFRPDRSNFKYLSRQIQFDESLRQLLWRMLERVELAIRSVIANHLSLQVSPHWFLDRSLFKHDDDWSFVEFCARSKTKWAD